MGKPEGHSMDVVASELSSSREGVGGSRMLQVYHPTVQVMRLSGVRWVNAQLPRKKFSLNGAPGWLSQLSTQLLLSFMISQFMKSRPGWGSELPARSLLGVLSLPLHPSSTHMFSLSLSLSLSLFLPLSQNK